MCCDTYCKSIGVKYYTERRESTDFNNIGDNGATAIAKALETNTTLSDLDLRSNNIGENGATAIAKALKQILHYRRCILIIITLVRMAQRQLQKHWKQILHYRICIWSNNNIGDNGATAIAKALETNTTLSTLNLEYNNIGKEAISLLLNIGKYKREGTNGYKKVEGFSIEI